MKKFKSPEAKRPLAVLRHILGKSQPEMATLIGCPLPTLRAWERGQRRLKPDIARRICLMTGVGLEWLLQDDPKVPPVDLKGKPFKRNTFDVTQVNNTALEARVRALEEGLSALTSELRNFVANFYPNH